MGNSHSSRESMEDDVNNVLEASSSEGAKDNTNERRRDISPVVSEQDQEEGQAPIPACTPENLYRPGSRNALAQQGAVQPNSEGNNPWNMMQASRGDGGAVNDTINQSPDTEPSRGAIIREELNVDEEPGMFGDIEWQPSAEVSPESCLEDAAQATWSFLSSEVSGAILGEEWESEGHVREEDGRFIEGSATGISLSDYSRPTGLFFPWTPPSMAPDPSYRRLSDLSETGSGESGISVIDFYPPLSLNYEWMGRSIETLTLGHRAAAPVLALPEQVEGPQQTAHDDEISDRPEGRCTRRSSVCSLDTVRSPHLAARRTSLSRGASFRRRNSCARSTTTEDASNAGPNVLLSLLAREGTGKQPSTITATCRLREMGGSSLLNGIDIPAGGIVTEAALLKDALDRGDWTETQIIVSRLAPRLVGDPTRARNHIDDPSLPASASRFHAGGGRLGLEREAFVASGGVRLLLRVFDEPAFVGDEIRQSNDARDLSDGMVSRKLASCWNEVLASLRELVYALPVLVESGEVLDGGEFLPFLFTLLAHDSCFDGAAALLEEILSSQSNSLLSPSATDDGVTNDDGGMLRGYIAPVSTFFLGNVPDLYDLLAGFNCRQLAHFCRLLALLVFEPEDRQVLESPNVLRSVELLQLRRDRAVRAGRDATVDMNQSILIGDVTLLERLLMLLRVMNFAPPLTNSTPYHVMAYFPFIAGTLPMVGLNEISDFHEVVRLERLARTLLLPENDQCLSDLGGVAGMLEVLSGSLNQDSLEQNSQIGLIISVVNAAAQAGVVVGMPSQSRPGPGRRSTPSQGTGASSDNLASTAIALADPFQSLHSSGRSNVQAGGVQVVSAELEEDAGGEEGAVHRIQGPVNASAQARINSPEDAANELQFNSFILAPYQVEVLFVICTLLGGRRKIDTQNLLRNRGIISILEELFHRLPFGSSRSGSSVDANDASSENRAGNPSAPSVEPQEEPQQGIHGPGCECTPESAMSVQFLRLLHNFCDRDCDNHTDRRLLLSTSEREFIFSSDCLMAPSSGIRPGLLSKVIQAFMSESDDSPYRFWLASCVESYLRGSCVQEQLFVAQSGLLFHLLDHVTSKRIHCAGSLQTSFDLLGELCKGNIEVLRLLMSHLDENRFQRLMHVAGSNLVDSNVFIRSLILSVEKSVVSRPLDEDSSWRSKAGPSTRFYLTHSWWDLAYSSDRGVDNDEQHCDDARPSDWFPPFREYPPPTIALYSSVPQDAATIYRDGWAFPREVVMGYESGLDWPQKEVASTLARFLGANRTRLLLDLLQVVDLGNINHENICCLNTAVILMIFAHRRGQLNEIVKEIKGMEDHNRFIKNVESLSIRQDTSDQDVGESEPDSVSRDRNVSSLKQVDAVQNFRELLWFWSEYYSHRGRDRISIEFSSHLHFHEWQHVVSMLAADDGSSASLVGQPLRLPRSPYQCAPRMSDNMNSHFRGT